MAFQTRDRDPLLDKNMSEAIGKRGRELFGLGLVAIGILTALMIGSYTSDDPSWMSSTDTPAQNYLGTFGASVAAPLFMIAGFASWTVALIPLVWGLRYVFHQGDNNALFRLIYAPIWIALTALCAAALTHSDEWANLHSFGLGGLFGDMVLGLLLSVIPLGQGMVFLLFGIVSVLVGAFVLGFSFNEIRQGIAAIKLSVLILLVWTLQIIRRGFGDAMRFGQAIKARKQATREMRMREKEARRMEEVAIRAVPNPEQIRVKTQSPMVYRQQPVQQHASVALTADMAQVMTAARPVAASQPDQQASGAESMAVPASMPTPMAAPIRQKPAQQQAPSLLKRVSSLLQADTSTSVQSEDIAQIPQEITADMPQGDRVRARIADAISARLRKGLQAYPEPVKGPSKTRPKGPNPLILQDSSSSPLPAEPPLQASVNAAPVARVTEPRMRYAPDETPMVEIEPLIEPSDVSVEPQLQAASMRAAIPHPVERSVVQHNVRKTPVQSQRAQAEAQPPLQLEEKEPVVFDLPPLALLENPEKITRHQLSDEALEQNARMLENVLDDYGVKGEIVSVRPGPVVTMYELEPAPGLKASRVIGLSDDIARSMSALSARVSTVPGRSVIGIELPNENREMVLLRELLATRDFGDGNQRLPMALGKDIGGDPVVSDLARMPHLLIAGTTGSGKSVAINTMILSLLYKLTPDQCRLIMIDPKMLELSVYDGIPHLLSPVVTDPKKAVVALKWVVAEMEERYRKMSKMGVRNIDGYNSRVEDALGRGEKFSRTLQTGFDDATGDPIFETEEFAPEKMPYIVVIVDEMADLMMVAGKEIEACIQRLAQMARASGIHLIMATQRPSVDVITGTVKANFPTRISFQVTSKIDSRTILGEMGAEQLLGMGDMLYMAGGGKITRCHGPFVSDLEVEEVVKHLKSYGPPEYVGGVVEGPDEDKANNIDAVLGLGGNTDGEDALYDQAVAIALQDRKCSTSYIQRKLSIGYNKAARLVEQMEEEGVVSAANHVGKREILVPEQ